ncbi:MAG: hypothetical protein KBD60_13935 [Sterolibacterium sp.]|jgi:hypothetical protein|nr:hypothetical protein [Sterolibacterium sp.]
MFARIYLILGLFATVLFSYAQYRGVGLFDSYASNTRTLGGHAGNSHTYHK